MVIPVTRLDVGEITQEVRARRVSHLIANTISVPSGCWEWQKFRNNSGYGCTSFKGKPWMAHRLMWVLLKGPLPPKLYVCHRCDRKGRCPQRAKTHCKHGHPYDGENLYIDPRGHRHCRKCHLAGQRMHKGGWTKEQAFSLPVTPHGHAPVGGNWERGQSTEEGSPR